MNIAGREIRAVILDMDGVLLDSEPLHFRAVNRILADEQAVIDEEFYKRYIGTTLEYTWDDLVAHFGLRKPYSHYAGRYSEEILAIYRTDSVPAPGAADLLGAIRQAGLKLALASSSNRAWVDTCLDCLGFSGRFDATVAGDEVTEGKPAPEIYLRAAQKLGEEPAACLVVEDAPHGVASGKAAGMTVIAVDTPYTRDIPIPQADLRLPDLGEVAALIQRAARSREGVA